MLPDIGHFIEVLIDSSLTAGIPEKRLVRSGSTGCDNHAVEPLFPYRICDLLGIVR